VNILLTLSLPCFHSCAQYSCALCLDAVCGDCSARRLDLPDLPNRLASGPQRVCDACFGFLAHGGSMGASVVDRAECEGGSAIRHISA
jgi:hypothetical protein